MTTVYEVDVGNEVLEIEGDRPPTKAEVENYLGRTKRPAANDLVEYAKPEAQKQREALAGADALLAQQYPDAGITPNTAPQAGDITTTGQALGKVTKQAAQDVGPTIARVGVPIAAALAPADVWCARHLVWLSIFLNLCDRRKYADGEFWACE